jgi:hypothetical protein
LLRHCTHWPVGTQIGALAAQSEFARHATHVESCVLQRGAGAAQSVFCWHCPHAPVLESHLGALRGHVVAFVPVHDGWHW